MPKNANCHQTCGRFFNALQSDRSFHFGKGADKNDNLNAVLDSHPKPQTPSPEL